MGLFDVSFPEPANIVERAKKHNNTLGVLAGAAGVGVGASAVTGAPLASVVIPIIAQRYLDTAVDEVFGKADESLRKASESQSGSMARACDGLCQLIDPVVSDDGQFESESLEHAARENPEQIKHLFEQLLTDDSKRDELQQVEQTLSALFAGEEPPEGAPIEDTEPETIVKKLKEIFDTEDEREALYLYTRYSDLLDGIADTAVEQEGWSDDPNSKEAVESIKQQLRQVGEWTTEVVDTLTRLSLKNQAFRQLTALDFGRQDPFRSKPPRYLWLMGFNFAELAARHGTEARPYYFERVLPPDHQLATSDNQQESVSSALVDELRYGSNVMLIGPPGSGKSHLCKRVAVEWYGESIGDVFYRESVAEKPFEEVAQLERAIEAADSDNSGPVLVVVEDAVADHANDIFEIMDEFRRRTEVDVRFLLDSRRSQWETYASDEQPRVEPPPYVRTAYKNGNNGFLRVVEAPQLTQTDCRNAIRTFNQTTQGYYGPPEKSTDQLYSAATDGDTTRGQLLILSDRLLTRSEYGHDSDGLVGDAPVRDSAGDLHARWLDEIDHNGREVSLSYRLAIVVSTLTVANIDVAPAHLYAVASDRREIRSIADILEGSTETPVDIRGTMLIPDKSSISGFVTRHTYWAFEFLSSKLQAGTATADTVHETFIRTISNVASLADDTQLQENIRRWLERQGTPTPFLDRVAEQPQQAVENFLQAVVSIGRQGNGELAVLLQESFLAGRLTDQESLPEIIDPLFRFELEIQRGWILEQAAGNGEVQDDPEQLFETVIKDATEALTPPERDWIRARAAAARAEIAKSRLRYPDAIKRFETAIEHYESINETHQAATMYRRLANLGRTTERIQWEVIDDRYDRAITLFERENDHYEVLRTVTARASAAITEESINWGEILAHQRQALNSFEASEPDPEYAYWYRRTLREQSRVAQESSVLQWETVITRYKRAINAFETADYPLIVARFREDLATAASEAKALEFDQIVSQYERSIEIFKRNELDVQVGRVYRSLAKASYAHDTSDWNAAERYYERALSSLESAGADDMVIDVMRERANSAASVDTLSWSQIEKYYQELIEVCLGADTPTDGARAARDFAEAAVTTAPDFETIDERYQQAIDRFESIGYEIEAARLAKRRAEVVAEQDDVNWTDIEEAYQAAIEYAADQQMDFECARIKRSRAREAKKQAVDLKITEYHFKEAAAAFAEIDEKTKAAMTYRWLAQAAAQVYDAEWKTVQNHFEESTERFMTNENIFEVARNHQICADIALNNRAEPWEQIEDRYTNAVEAYETANHPDRIAETLHKLGNAACELPGGTTEEAMTYYRAADEQWTEIDSDETVQRVRVAVDATANFIDAGSKLAVEQWLSNAVDYWCNQWMQTNSRADRSTLRSLGAQIGRLLPAARETVTEPKGESTIETWCEQLSTAVSEESPSELHDAIMTECDAADEE